MNFAIGTQYKVRIQGLRQEQLNRFGKLMGTAGRIHTEPEWAAASPAGGVLVQGGLIMSPLHDLMSSLVGETRWLQGSEVAIKMVSFTRLGEPLTLSLDVVSESDDHIGFNANWSKDDGTVVMVADIQVKR